MEKAPLNAVAIVGVEMGAAQPIVSCVSQSHNGQESRRSIGFVIEHRAGVRVEMEVRDPGLLVKELTEALVWAREDA